MANLIIPDKTRHSYIVGIDYGHGETSAAICAIEWDKDAGQRETNVLDIDLDVAARKKVITSAICHVSKGGILIGDEAFEHMTDNNGIRICFKQKPHSIDGDAERLMIDYMKAVYLRIRESQEVLTDTNHIVYIARPSGWTDEDAKEMYRQMAIQAGIPLGGLTSESRAAIFYAKSPSVGFTKEISKGAIVFDLGSSTLDFTYLSDTDKPIDYGYNLGASIIDNAILENIILKNEDVCDFLDKYPCYRDALKFKARKFKEDAYSRNEDSKTVGGFTLENIIAENESSYNDYADKYVKLRITNLSELNSIVNSSTHYMDELKEALIDFKINRIPGKKINGVFLTGGASRMNFIRPLIAETLEIDKDNVKIDSDNPSLTISRGIALLGATDAITSVLVSELKSELPSLINNDSMLAKLRVELRDNITNQSWNCVKEACQNWVKYGKTTDTDEMKEFIKSHLRVFQQQRVSSIVNDSLQSFFYNTTEDIRKRMNEIISRYAPGREISSSATINIDNISFANKSLSDMSKAIAQICDDISGIIGDILWAALGVFLWGVLAAPYYLIKGVISLLTSDEDKRKDKADKLLEKEGEIKSKVRANITSELRNNTSFNNLVSTSLNNYFSKLIDHNLQQVKIPIE